MGSAENPGGNQSGRWPKWRDEEDAEEGAPAPGAPAPTTEGAPAPGAPADTAGGALDALADDRGLGATMGPRHPPAQASQQPALHLADSQPPAPSQPVAPLKQVPPPKKPQTAKQPPPTWLNWKCCWSG